MRYGMMIDLDRCIACGACAMACKMEHATPAGTYWCNVHRKEVGEYPTAEMRFLPTACMHCDNPECVNVCPTNASYKREDGIVLVDADKCIGCRACINACSYNARHYNFTDPEKSSYYETGEQTPFEKAKMSEHQLGKTEKCVLCVDRVTKGREPACVETCITKARVFGDLDDPKGKLAKAIREKKAKPLYPHLGSKPSVRYSGEF